MAGESAVIADGLANTDREPQNDVPLVRISVDVPAELAHGLRARIPRLDIGEALLLVAQLYADAPVERGLTYLTKAQYTQACEALGFSPRNPDEFVHAIEQLVTVSVAGVHVKFDGHTLMVIKSRNVNGLPIKEFVAQILRECIEAWRDGRI